MTFSFHHTASAELDDAIDYYENNEPGLGYEFLEEVYAAITLIFQYPSAWNQLSRRTRRCIMKRFPYELIYQVVEGEIRILAVAHMHRRPGYWIGRGKDEEGAGQNENQGDSKP